MSLTQRLIKMVDVYHLPANPYPPKGLWRFIWHFVSQYKAIIASMYVLSMASSSLNALGPFILRHIVDTLLTTPNRAEAWVKLMPLLALYLGICMLLSILLYCAMSFLRATSFNSGLTHVIRRQLHWYLLNHSWSFFQSDFAGRLANKIMEIGSEIRNILNSTRRMFWVFATFATGCITLMLTQPWLLLPFVAYAILFTTTIIFMVPHIRKLAQAFSDTRSLCVGRMVDSYTNIQTVKLFAGQQRENTDLADVMHEARMRHADVQLANFKLDVVVLALETFLIGGLLISSLWLWKNGQATPGTIAMVIPLALMMVQQASMLREELGAMLESLGTIEDGMNALVHPISVKDSPTASLFQNSGGLIELKDATFAYHAGAEPIISNLNLTIPAGQKVGLIGSSGAGKSTLVNLLLRFYDLSSGTILIDGQNISHLTQESLRANIGMVSQDTSLLHRSIRENIAYGKPEASDAEITAAAKLAHAHEFILNLNDKDGNTGYMAKVGERGVKLSGGQRQRIAIARLILKNAPILILDEATSALDSEVEHAIQENLATLMSGKTVIAIAHRLSTIAALDRLLVIENGKILEDGSHSQLLKKKGTYAKLWTRQSGGFLPE